MIGLLVGSTNLNNSAFYKLGECSLVIKDKDVNNDFLKEHDSLMNESIKIKHHKDIKYNKILAFLEQIMS